jgi:hypothetical protein
VKRRTTVEPTTTSTTTTTVTRAATLTGFTAAVATTHGVHLRDLAPMTTLHVQTRNSQYRIIISTSDAVLVEGGQFFPCLTPAHVSGASVGGSFLKVGWIGVGLRMEILVDGRRIVTSPVLDISAAPADTRVH